ncbi:6869_t:CDS:1, partial [Rhizophagus irregularis]
IGGQDAGKIFIPDFKNVLNANVLEVYDNSEFFLLLPELRSECNNSEFFSSLNRPSFGRAQVNNSILNLNAVNILL